MKESSPNVSKIILPASRIDGDPRHPLSAPTNSSYETVLSLMVDTLKPLVVNDRYFVLGFGAESNSSIDASDLATNYFCFDDNVLTTGVQGEKIYLFYNFFKFVGV